MLFVAVLFRAVSHLENWKNFHEFHVAATSDDGHHF